MAMKLIDNPNTNHLCESMQANEVKFTFVSITEDGHFAACIPWVKCREYFNEFLMANTHEDFDFNETYGLTYDKTQFPWDMKNPHIALKFKNKHQKEVFLSNVDFIHEIDDVNKLSRTVVIDVDYSHPSVVLQFDPEWVGKCVSFNIYTTLLKLMCLQELKKGLNALSTIFVNGCRPAEVVYITGIGEQKFSNLCQSIRAINSIKSKYVDGSSTKRGAYTVHGNSGIFTILTFCNPKENEFYGMNKTFVKTIIHIAENENFPSIFKEAA